MQAGRLRHSMTIQKPVRVAGTGAPTEKWETFARARWSLEPISRNEEIEAGVQNAEMTHRARTRPYIAGVTSRMRLRHDHDGRVFKIVGTPKNVMERNRVLELKLQRDNDA